MKDLPVSSIEDVERALHEHRYVADRSLATTIFLALTLDKPLLLEGEAGVGKTEVGKVLAEILDSRLIRLQCYEGIDEIGRASCREGVEVAGGGGAGRA